MTKKELGSFVEGICQILTMLNLYTEENSKANEKFLESKRKNKDDLLKHCTETSYFVTTTLANLNFLNTFMLENGLEVVYDPDLKKYFLLHNGKIVEIQYE